MRNMANTFENCVTMCWVGQTEKWSTNEDQPTRNLFLWAILKEGKAAMLHKYPRVVVTEFEMKSSGFIGGKREHK